MPLTICCNEAEGDPPDGEEGGGESWILVEQYEMDNESSYSFSGLDPSDIHVYNIDFQGIVDNTAGIKEMSLRLNGSSANYYSEASLVTLDPVIGSLHTINAKSDGLLLGRTMSESNHSLMMQCYISHIEDDRKTFQGQSSMTSSGKTHHNNLSGEWFNVVDLTSILFRVESDSSYTGTLRLFKQLHKPDDLLRAGSFSAWLNRVFNLLRR